MKRAPAMPALVHGGERCERCRERLAPARVRWLELDTVSNRYHIPGEVAAGRSQGCFPFGVACAHAVLAADGLLVRLERTPREGRGT